MFNENFKRLRKEKGFSQLQVATRLNVVRQTVSKWENGLSVPDAETLIELAEVLEVSVDDLLGKSIEIEEKEDFTGKVASELAKLNELLVIQQQKSDLVKKKAAGILAVIFLLILIGAVYDQWCDMFYELGRNLYRLFH